jgi:hypothetical protein
MAGKMTIKVTQNRLLCGWIRSQAVCACCATTVAMVRAISRTADNAAVMGLRPVRLLAGVVKRDVIGFCHQLQVLDAIVRPILIDVVDVFIRPQRPSNVFLHHHAMFVDRFPVDNQSDIAVVNVAIPCPSGMICACTRLGNAGTRAEDSATDFQVGRLLHDYYPALRTDTLNGHRDSSSRLPAGSVMSAARLLRAFPHLQANFIIPRPLGGV